MEGRGAHEKLRVGNLSRYNQTDQNGIIESKKTGLKTLIWDMVRKTYLISFRK